MRICLRGAGAPGSATGGSLGEGGADVVLVDAWAEHVPTIDRDGLALCEGGVDREVRAATGAAGVGSAGCGMMPPSASRH